MPDIQPAEQTPVSQNECIGRLHAQGYPQNYIAKQVGLSQQTISRRLNNDEVCQAIVEQTRKLNAQLLPKAYKKHALLIDSDTDKIAMDAITLTYKTTGILPTRTGDNYFIGNVNIGPLTPAALDYMEYLKDRDNDDVVDVMPE